MADGHIKPDETRKFFHKNANELYAWALFQKSPYRDIRFTNDGIRMKNGGQMIVPKLVTL